MYASNKSYILLKPKAKSNLEIEFNSCLFQLKKILLNNHQNSDSILKQTIFINANNKNEYHEQQNFLQEQLQKFYNSTLPPTSFIAQPPEDQQQCALELILLKSDSTDIELQRKKLDDISYTVLYYSETKEVYGGGLSCAFNSYDPLECARNSFDIMERILKKENLTFANVVRQWNYIEGILDKKPRKGGIKQNYQIFNDVRSNYYSKSNFLSGYPAATGIGMNTGGIILEFIAVNNTQDVNIIPIKNPRQVNAYSYSDEVLVGRPIQDISKKTSPKFERAKFMAIDNIVQIFISGTAAILGQDSVSEQDARIQTTTTIENIQQLICESNLKNHNIHQNAGHPKLSYLRVYVKKEYDLEDVKAVCEKYYPNISTLYLISDICRDDLLVELEGVANLC